MDWNYLDIVFAILAAFMVLRGLIRGALAEFFSLGAIAAGIAGGVIFSADLGRWVEAGLGLNGWGRIIAFLGIFLITYVVMKILEKALRGFVDSVNLQNLDKALGLFLGLIEGAALVGIIIFVLHVQPIDSLRNLADRSLCGRTLKPLMGLGSRPAEFLDTDEKNV
jgi:membrane protein required for colicin V production